MKKSRILFDVKTPVTNKHSITKHVDTCLDCVRHSTVYLDASSDIKGYCLHHGRLLNNNTPCDFFIRNVVPVKDYYNE